ncbi:MAG: hypothetical protein QXD13_01665, partial [Candidatus Pacearchaeota archaeon]
MGFFISFAISKKTKPAAEARIESAEKNNPKELPDLVKELKKAIAEFDKQLQDEIKALIGLRLNALYLIITISSQSETALKQLQALLKSGFPESVEKKLELK